MNLVALAAAIAPILAPAPGVGVAITTTVELVAALRSMASHVAAIPAGPDGQPLTLEAATAHLAEAQATSHRQTDRMRANAAAALAENETETKGAGE